MAEYNWYDFNNTKRSLKELAIQKNSDEYDKDSPKQRACAIEVLRHKIQESQVLRGEIKTDDKNLIRFLYARKFNMPETLNLIENYYDYKQKHPEIFQVTNGTKLAIKDGFPSILKDRDRRGRCVLVLNSSNWDTNIYSLIDIFRALIISLEKLTLDSHNQICGFVIIIDWSEFTLKQSANLNPRLLKIIVEGLQDCYPAKFKGIHFIGQPWYVATALTVMKPFLKEKARNRIHLHGNNLATLHEHVTIDILPTELGGEGPPLDTARWADQIFHSL
ncbi:clavesin-2-like [Chrysoperla carnea]|uniref:clavesin-2-like n=1 Tax=Chrysoperla carnea TaxID=189513 RepID=UPI001D077A89|nr:clavesin-2-like [Chrysoperla carnea]